ncbi:hypothetical protein ABE47_31560 [Bacillus thuringiensis]|uniref:Uncharacterized protein n=2 Tax=Bacillus thuringiensis TaxID=1428 RepID=A0A9W3X0E3_BACTU|nr:hypothetical protein YBT1518_13870 [Bacillus thuringiensis YBT-1518]ANS48077.1 hypothetical protein BT246_27090 [Bacillus thuringiensis]MBG9481125.1 hypothetical protein [Bacillus thuringiensis]MBG9492468.1 hypothetical protein [Bacillus thuringiensis]MBG9498583.1 hypothetical protein [Bacillus thuringiensis]
MIFLSKGGPLHLFSFYKIDTEAYNMLVSLNKETNLSKYRITFMDEDTRHVINLRECKKVHTYKESFYNKDR